MRAFVLGQPGSPCLDAGDHDALVAVGRMVATEAVQDSVAAGLDLGAELGPCAVGVPSASACHAVLADVVCLGALGEALLADMAVAGTMNAAPADAGLVQDLVVVDERSWMMVAEEQWVCSDERGLCLYHIWECRSFAIAGAQRAGSMRWWLAVVGSPSDRVDNPPSSSPSPRPWLVGSLLWLPSYLEWRMGSPERTYSPTPCEFL